MSMASTESTFAGRGKHRTTSHSSSSTANPSAQVADDVCSLTKVIYMCRDSPYKGKEHLKPACAGVILGLDQNKAPVGESYFTIIHSTRSRH